MREQEREREREGGGGRIPLAKVIRSTSNRIDWLALKRPRTSLAPATGVLLFRRVTHHHPPPPVEGGWNHNWRLSEGERTLTSTEGLRRQFRRSVEDGSLSMLFPGIVGVLLLFLLSFVKYVEYFPFSRKEGGEEFDKWGRAATI